MGHCYLMDVDIEFCLVRELIMLVAESKNGKICSETMVVVKTKKRWLTLFGQFGISDDLMVS